MVGVGFYGAAILLTPALGSLHDPGFRLEGWLPSRPPCHQHGLSPWFSRDDVLSCITAEHGCEIAWGTLASNTARGTAPGITVAAVARHKDQGASLPNWPRN